MPSASTKEDDASAAKTSPPPQSDEDVVVLHHPLPKMDPEAKAQQQATLYVYGSRTAKHLIIMCGGYPDNHSVFGPFAQRLADTCHCLVGITCPPGYDDTMDWKLYPPGGFEFQDWPVTLREAVKCLRSYSTCTVAETTLTGIFHDWGVVAGTMYTNQTVKEEEDKLSSNLKPDRIVLLDILLRNGPQTPNRIKGHDNQTAYQKFSQACYTFFLACVFLVSRYMPKYVTLVVFLFGATICQILNVFPLSSHDKVYAREHVPIQSMDDLERIWYMGYPYWRFWQLVLSGKVKDFLVQTSQPDDLAVTPVLHLYGASKPYSLSDANALLQLEQEQTNGRPSRVVRVDDAGHWLFVQQPEVCLQAMHDFFKASGVPSPSS